MPGAREMATECETDRESERKRERGNCIFENTSSYIVVFLSLLMLLQGIPNTHSHTHTNAPPTCSITGHASAPAPELCCPRNSPQKNRKKCVLFMKTFRVFMNHNQHELPPVPCPLSTSPDSNTATQAPLFVVVVVAVVAGLKATSKRS